MKNELSRRSLQLLKPFLNSFDHGWEIELVISLHKGRDRSWSVLELSQQLMIDHTAVALSLAKLSERGLIIAKGDAFIYAPNTSEKHALVELMIRAFAQRRLDVIRAIYESD